MSLRVRLILLWALSSLLVIFLLFITGFLIFRRFSPTDQEILIEVLFPFRFHLLLPLVFLVLALIWGAKWFLEKYWFPLERMLEELELIRTVNPSLRIQTQGSTQLKALAAKLNQMAANTELTQQEIKKNIEQATRSLEEEKHLFEALLEHLPTGVIVTNSEGHLLLSSGRFVLFLHAFFCPFHQSITSFFCSSYPGLSLACSGSALCRLVFLHAAVLPDALVAGLHGDGDAFISA